MGLQSWGVFQVGERQADGEGLVAPAEPCWRMLGLILNSLGAVIMQGAPSFAARHQQSAVNPAGLNVQASAWGRSVVAWLCLGLLLQSEKGQFLRCFYYFSWALVSRALHSGIVLVRHSFSITSSEMYWWRSVIEQPLCSSGASKGAEAKRC